MGKINKRRADGITLIALIITIIILLILAGVSIVALSERGIFANANKAKLETKRAQVEEWLKLKVMEEQVNNPNGTSQEIIPKVRENVENNQDELKKIGKNVAVDSEVTIEENDNVCFYVIVDGDKYKVGLKEQKFIGEDGKILPVVKIESISSTTNTVKVVINTEKNDGGKIEYYIKSENDDEFIKKDTVDSEEQQIYLYKGLEQNKKYNIKIVAISKDKQKVEVTGEAKTGIVEVTGECNYEPKTFTKQSVTVTLPTKERI